MPPDTRLFFVAAYVAATLLYAGYALTLWWRERKARERWRTFGGG
jgi:hypothetical protein